MAPIRLLLVGFVLLLPGIPRCLGAVDAFTVSLRSCVPDAAKQVPCVDVSVVLDGAPCSARTIPTADAAGRGNVETDATTL